MTPTQWQSAFRAVRKTGCFPFLVAAALHADPRNPDTDWMSGQYGVGFHFLKGAQQGQLPDWNQSVALFDAEKFAADVERTGAKWVLFTLGQNSGYYCAPNRVLDSISGYQPGQRNSLRDLPMDISKALEPKGIRMLFYLPSSVPTGDARIAAAFGLSQREPGGANYMVNEAFMHKWAQVIREWSLHYGGKLHGWWFDGYYRRVGFTDSLGKIYRDAVRAGNARSVLSLCGGIRDQEELRAISNWSDYLCGEQNDAAWIPKERWYTGSDGLGPVQWQTFAQFTPDWTQDGNRYGDDAYVNYANATLKNGGAITWNLYVNANGSISPGVMAQLDRTRSRIRPAPLRLGPVSGPAQGETPGRRFSGLVFFSRWGLFDAAGRAAR